MLTLVFSLVALIAAASKTQLVVRTYSCLILYLCIAKFSSLVSLLTTIFPLMVPLLCPFVLTNVFFARTVCPLQCVLSFGRVRTVMLVMFVDHLIRSANQSSNGIQAHERFKITLFIRTKHSTRIFEVIPFMQLQNDTKTTIKPRTKMKNEMES